MNRLRITRFVPGRGRLAVLGGAAALAAAGGAFGVRGLQRLEVGGASMEPALRPGDRVLVVRGPARWTARPGRIVAVRDPRRPERVMVKRVTALGAEGVELRGDNPGASTDSRQLGPLSPRLVVGAVVYRYHPPERAGRLGSGR